MYMYLSKLKSPKAWLKHKHQKKFPLTPNLMTLILTVCRNQFLILWPTCLIMYHYDTRPELTELTTFYSILYIIAYDWVSFHPECIQNKPGTTTRWNPK